MLSIDPSNFVKKTAEAKLRIAKAAVLYADSAGKKLESEAKQKAPWTDRTSNARQSIKGYGQDNGGKAEIVLSGGMDYSVWLEFANEKRFAILWPTINRNSNEILKAWAEKVMK